MAVWFGNANNKATKIKNIYIGDSNNIARRISNGWFGNTNNIATLFYHSPYTYYTSTQSYYADRVTFSSYFVGINSSGNIEIRATATPTGTSTSNDDGRAIFFRIDGDVASKTITFDYTTSGYHALASTINLDEIYSGDVWNNLSVFRNSSGSASISTSSKAESIAFGIWFGGAGSNTRTVKFVISNLKIGNELVIF